MSSTTTPTPTGKAKTPDGGNGGDGGNVILRASSRSVPALVPKNLPVRAPPHRVKSLAGVPIFMRATGGAHGTSQARHGASGKDMVVDVPLGTVVYRLDAPNDKQDEVPPSRHLLDTEYEV